jgi:hypothetical protein
MNTASKPLSPTEIVRHIAKAASAGICRKVIRICRALPSARQDATAPLANCWEDICLHEQQGDHAAPWADMYGDTLLRLIKNELAKLDVATRWAIWHQTDFGALGDSDKLITPATWAGAELASHLLHQYVLPAAKLHSNRSIRAAIALSEQSD